MIFYMLTVLCYTILPNFSSSASLSITNQSTIVVQADACIDKLTESGMLKSCHEEVKRRWKVNLLPFPWEMIKNGNETIVKKGDNEKQCNAWYGLLYCVVFTSCMNCTVDGTVALEHFIAPLAKTIKLEVCSKWHINEDNIDEKGTAICGYLGATSSKVAFVVAIVATVFGLIFVIAQFVLCQYKKEERKASDARLKKRSFSKNAKLAVLSKQNMSSSKKKTLILAKAKVQKSPSGSKSGA